jgi:hypothetical protein
MPLKLNKPAGPSTKEITLPSEGYPYPQPELKGGQLLVRAFDFDTESLMYGTTDSTVKQFARLCTLLSRITTWPPGFKTAELLEGDSAFIVMAARSLTYPEQKYNFETSCEHCGEKEPFSLRIPDELPQNRYPADFLGYITLDTFNKNTLKMRFLTLADDAECTRISRDRVAKKAIKEDLFDSDYEINRLCFHLVEANGGKPENMEDSRQFFMKMSSDERAEIVRSLRRHAPGISSVLTINCPKCNGQYEAFVPLSADFFRPGAGTVRTILPGGVRISCFGPDDFRDKSLRAPTPNHDRIPYPVEKGGGGGTKTGGEKKVADTKETKKEKPEEVTRLEPGGDLVTADKSPNTSQPQPQPQPATIQMG